MSKGKNYFSKSLEKGLKTLALFNRESPVLTQSKIAKTEKTIVDKDELAAELKKIKARQYAISFPRAVLIRLRRTRV